MDLQFIKKPSKNLVEENDSLITKTALLISNCLLLDTGITTLLFIYITVFVKKMPDEQYLSFLIATHQHDRAAVKTFSEIQKILRKTNPAKLVKFSEKLRLYYTMKKALADTRAHQQEKYEKDISQKKLAPLMNFFDDGRLLMPPDEIIKSVQTNEDPYIEWLKYTLCKTTCIPVFEMPDGFFSDNITGDIDTEKGIIHNIPDYIEIPLYKIHDISDLTYEQLNCTRLNILQKAKDFNEKIEELRKESFTLDYSDENAEQIFCLVAEKLRRYKDLQKIIDNEIYIQQAKNSGKKLCTKVSVGVASIKTIVGYYEKTGALEPYIAAVLYKRIEETERAARCGVFFNISVVEDDD